MSSRGPSRALFYFSRLVRAKVRHFACVRWLRPLQPGRDRDSRCLGMTSWVPLESGVAPVGILALGDVAGRGIAATTSDDDGAILWVQTAPILKMQQFPTQVGENLEVDLAGEDGATD
ncbi:hypothetical protein BC828DRAFT_399899 [Blastocladiella britannica]|nr:hypothetical protein BC828DRAFT_399899 [Blastocladiella britannica]